MSAVGFDYNHMFLTGDPAQAIEEGGTIAINNIYLFSQSDLSI
jgi:hypothetical protein